MNKFAFLTSGTGVTVGAGAAFVAVIGVAGYVSGAFSRDEALSVSVADSALDVEVARLVEPVAPRMAGMASAPKTPSFDVVRVDGDGSAMIAGTAKAGSTVSIQVDDDVVAQVKADAGGKFASFVTLPDSTDARVLTLSSDVNEPVSERVIIAPVVATVVQAVPEIVETPIQAAVVTEDENVLVVEAIQEPTPLILVQEPAKTAKDAREIVDAVAPLIVAGPVTDQASLAENVAADVEEVKAPISEPVIDIATVEITQQMPDVAVDEPQIPVVILATDEGVRVLQSPNAPTPDAMTALLGSISYDDAGDVSLTGNAGGDFVRVYLNNRPIVTSQIAANGDWQAGLPSVDTGIYTLRVDELNEAGDVVARVETPFKREAAEVLAAASKPEKLVQAITVQPGATLWAIAKERYGSGTLYARVVEANADTIRNPDLIFPGQVFTVPD